MEKYSVTTFHHDMRRIIALLEENREQDARSVFNREIYSKYADIRGSDVENPLSHVILFFYDLDEYLNNQNARIAGVVCRKEVISSFYSDYQDELQKALAQEEQTQI